MTRDRLRALHDLRAQVDAAILREAAHQGITPARGRGIGFLVLPAPSLAEAVEEMVEVCESGSTEPKSRTAVRARGGDLRENKGGPEGAPTPPGPRPAPLVKEGSASRGR